MKSSKFVSAVFSVMFFVGCSAPPENKPETVVVAAEDAGNAASGQVVEPTCHVILANSDCQSEKDPTDDASSNIMIECDRGAVIPVICKPVSNPNSYCCYGSI